MTIAFLLFFLIFAFSYPLRGAFCATPYPPALKHLLRQLPEWEKFSLQVQIEKIETGLTNHNFKVIFPTQTYFVRLGSDNPTALGLNSDREHFCTQAAASLGIAPAVIKYLSEEHAMAFPFIESKPLQKSRENYQRVLSLLRQFHQSGFSLPTTFSPYDAIRDYYRHVTNLQLGRCAAYASYFLTIVEEIEKAVPSFREICPCHLDLYTLNFLDDGAKIFIIDWEYSAMADPLFDLATLVESDNLSLPEMQDLLDIYLDAPTREDFAYLYLMSILAHIRMGLWSCIQAEVSQIKTNYSAFADDSFNRALHKTRLPQYRESLLLIKKKSGNKET